MKQSKFKSLPLIALFIACIAIAGTSKAYTVPSAAAPGNNSSEPLDVSAISQVKNAGLSVNTFIARGNALFSQKAIFDGLIRAGLPTDVNSTVNIGGTSGGNAYGVEVQATGSVKAADVLNSSALTHGNSEDPQICSDASGNIIICQYGPYVTGTPAIQEIRGYGYILGGEASNPVLCTVRLTSAPTNNESFDLKYTYNHASGNATSSCVVTVGAGTTYGETEVGGVNPAYQVSHICVQSATMTIPTLFKC